MKRSKKEPLVNVLTESGGALLCRSVLLGHEFDLEISIAGDGQLTLVIDGNPNSEEAAQLLATKCEVPVESILPLLVVNLALLMEKRVQAYPSVSTYVNPTIH